MLTILFDGIAYGMLLFVLACGLSVTLGLMNFVNLAHGAFAMAGGYITVIMMNRYGMSFYWCLPAAFVVTALVGALLERLLYRRLYSASHLDQVLFSIGLVFMSISAIDYFMGGQQQLINLPPELSGRFGFLGIDIGRYRLFIIVICAVLTVALQLALTRTRFGSQLRAAVDDGRVARGMGINVSVIFALTFALGSGLAGLGVGHANGRAFGDRALQHRLVFDFVREHLQAGYRDHVLLAVDNFDPALVVHHAEIAGAEEAVRGHH